MINSMIKEEEITGSMEDVSTDFGIDSGGPVADVEPGTVRVPVTEPPLEDEQLEEFIGHIDTVTSFEDFGVQHYINSKLLLQSMLIE